MSKHTSFRIGGPARLYVVASSADEVVRAVTFCLDRGIPWFVYGGGSNLLVADEGFEGVLIQVANRRFEVEGTRVHAEAGAITALVARKSVEAGLKGFEWAIGVPGTIGGAVFGDAGCYGGEMKDAVVSVEAFRLADRARVTYTKEECQFGYRESRFKREPHLILQATLELSPSPDPAATKARLEEIVRTRKEKQPLEQSSCGCVFKNQEITDDLEILRRQVDVPEGMLKSKMLSAGWLIEQAGMLGASVGDMEVSLKHGNFFLNHGKARAQDVVALISRVKMKVRDELGVELHEEVQYLGFS